MKTIGLFLLFVTKTFARTRPVNDIPERNADDGNSSSQQYIAPCALSPDGTFMSTDGDYAVVVDYTFRMGYTRGYSVAELLQNLSAEIGNSIIEGIFSDLCHTRRWRRQVTSIHDYVRHPVTRKTSLSDLSSVIRGLDTNIQYNWNAECSTDNNNNACDEFSGGIKLFLDSPAATRKLLETKMEVVEPIKMIIKASMNSGDVASKVDGIDYLIFYSNQKDSDEQAANDLEEELIEDITSSLVNNDQPGEQHYTSSSGRNEKLKSAGWGILGVSAVIVAVIGYRYKKAKSDSLSSSEIEIEDVLIDGVGDEERESPIQDSVEVVYE